MILSDVHYGERFNVGVERATKELGDLLQIRVTKGGGEMNREKALFVIIKQAARLSEEINRQVAQFQLHPIVLASPYNPEIMEDRSGLLSDEEKEQNGKARGILVQKVLFPIVLRYGFDEAGKFLDAPVIVRKGTVVIMRSEKCRGES